MKYIHNKTFLRVFASTTMFSPPFYAEGEAGRVGSEGGRMWKE